MYVHCAVNSDQQTLCTVAQPSKNHIQARKDDGSYFSCIRAFVLLWCDCSASSAMPTGSSSTIERMRKMSCLSFSNLARGLPECRRNRRYVNTWGSLQGPHIHPPQTYTVGKTARHTLVIVNCETPQDVSISGRTIWMNPFGYLPGHLYGYLPVQ